MGDKRVTLKNVAQEMGVSLGTVHRAIYNKKGVSEATRQTILEYVEKNNYKINVAASSLKRGTVKIGVALPKPVGNEKYFFSDMWNGIQKAVNDFKDFNIEIVKIEFTGDYTNQKEVMEDFYNRHLDEISGLITHIWNDTELNPIINKFTNAGVPVTLVMTDAPNSKRICCVSPLAHNVGMMAGELISNYIIPGGRVIILGGKREVSTHQDVVLGFLQSIKENSPGTEVIEIYDFNSYYENDRMQNTLQEYLEKFDDIKGIYSNSARGTILFCKTLLKLKKEGKIKAIGSDVNYDSAQYLKNGVIQGIIYQNPCQQAYKAFQILFNYIIKDEVPERNVYTNASIVIKSNLSSFI